MRNTSQKARGIPGSVSPVHFSNDRLSRHVSNLRTVLADNDSDGKAIRLALRDANSLGKKKCSQGTDVQSNTNPHFTIKQPTFDEMFPQRTLCRLITSLHQLLSEPATGRQCSCLRERRYWLRPFGTCVPPGDQQGARLLRSGCLSPRGGEGLLSASEVGQKEPVMPTSDREGERKRYFLDYLSTMAWWSYAFLSLNVLA